MAFVRLNKRHVMLCYVIMPFQISLNFAHPEVVTRTLIDLLQRVFPVFFVMYTFDVR